MTQAPSKTTEDRVTVDSPVWQKLEQIAQQFNLSVSDFLENIANGQLKVVGSEINSKTAIAADIANYFIWFASHRDVEINAYKLQKLLYCAEAWHLGIYGNPLFNSDFQAWVHGPVIPALLERYTSQFSWEAISEKVDRPKLSEQICDFLEEVAEAYFEYDDDTLERIICSETPWLAARGNLPRDESCHAIITQESMKKYYSARVKEETSI